MKTIEKSLPNFSSKLFFSKEKFEQKKHRGSLNKRNTKEFFIFLVIITAFCLFIPISTWGHEAGWPGKRLAKVFPKAKKFSSKKVTLNPEQIGRIEKATGEKIGAEEKTPTFYLAYGTPEKKEEQKASPSPQPIKEKEDDKPQLLGAVVFIDALGQNGNMEVNVAIDKQGKLLSVSFWSHSENKKIEGKEAGFKITEQSLENLKSEGVPVDVLEKLQSLKNQEFIGEKDFLDKLEETIGDEQTAMFKSSILKHALTYFLKQFNGKLPDEPFKVGDDIKPVQGLEKTSQAVATAAKKGALMFQEVFGKQGAKDEPKN